MKFKNYGQFGNEKNLTTHKEYAIYEYNKKKDLIGFAGAVGYRHMRIARVTMTRDRKVWHRFRVNKYNPARKNRVR